jgi:hypothetical protein
MVYVYKNFLIVDREEKMQKATQLVSHLNAGFNDNNRIWHAKSPYDKVVLVYKNPLIADNEIHSFAREEEIRFALNDYLGYIHVYCQGQNIKIDKFKIGLRLSEQEQYWRTYKAYLCQTIRTAGILPAQLSNSQYVLHWGKMSSGVADFMTRIGLLDDRSKKIYVFKPQDLQPTGFRSFGSGFNNSFDPNWGGNWGNGSQFSFPAGNSFNTFGK